MKLSDEYPNYYEAIQFILDGKNAVKGSDDKKLLNFYVPLANFKKGFDYYDLKKDVNGNVFIEIETMLSFKPVVKTTSSHFNQDFSSNEWVDIIFRTSMEHFNKEDYIALKKGYVNKASNNSGCVLSLIILIAFTSLTLILL